MTTFHASLKSEGGRPVTVTVRPPFIQYREEEGNDYVELTIPTSKVDSLVLRCGPNDNSVTINFGAGHRSFSVKKREDAERIANEIIEAIKILTRKRPSSQALTTPGLW